MLCVLSAVEEGREEEEGGGAVAAEEEEGGGRRRRKSGREQRGGGTGGGGDSASAAAALLKDLDCPHPLSVLLRLSFAAPGGAGGEVPLALAVRFRFLVRLRVVTAEAVGERSAGFLACLFPHDTGLAWPNEVRAGPSPFQRAHTTLAMRLWCFGFPAQSATMRSQPSEAEPCACACSLKVVRMLSGGAAEAQSTRELAEPLVASLSERRDRPFWWCQHLAALDFLPDLPPSLQRGSAREADGAPGSLELGLESYRKQKRVGAVLQQLQSRKLHQHYLKCVRGRHTPGTLPCPGGVVGQLLAATAPGKQEKHREKDVVRWHSRCCGELGVLCSFWCWQAAAAEPLVAADARASAFSPQPLAPGGRCGSRLPPGALDGAAAPGCSQVRKHGRGRRTERGGRGPSHCWDRAARAGPERRA